MTRHLIRSATALLVWLAAAPLVAQESRTATRPVATPAKSPPVALAPPKEGVPFPSLVPSLDATPPELLVGAGAEYPLETKRPAVIDGDTLRVAGLPGSIRFIGLDAEETFKDAGKERLAAADWDEYLKTENAGKNPQRPPKLATPMGQAAKSGLELLLKDATKVRLEYDDAARKVDGFDRMLAFVFVRRPDGWLNVNVEIVRQGWSPYFVKYGRSKRFDAAFAAAQREAREAGRGIWGPQAPYRHCADYDVRLKWWNERADAWQAAEEARAARDDVFLLGRADEWERLKGAVGRRAIVVGTIEGYRAAGEVGLLSCAHVAKRSFLVVGAPKDVEALDAVKRFEGDLVFLTGTVELYKGEPQFRHTPAAPVQLSKAPPPPTPK
jgi:endonuclease YncB( thermonuclease family)